MPYRQTFFKPNKYNAVKQTYNGYNYDSKFEARVAAELDMEVIAKVITDYERQFKVEIYAYTKDGEPVRLCSHKIDFRRHLPDGTFELLEAKGVETSDYKWRRKMLENFWLPEHPDHVYRVVKQQNAWRPR